MDSPKRGTRSTSRKCLCLSITAVVLALGLLFLILGLTIFKAKHPVTTVNSISLADLDLSVDLTRLRVLFNVSLDVNTSVKNPNRVCFKYQNITVVLRHRGKEVGEVPVPAGRIVARSSESINLTLTIMADRMLSDSAMYSDVVSGTLPLQTYMSVSGKEKISKFILVKKSTGRSFNAEVRNRKEYRNPDFLQHVVTYQHIDQIGSCLRIDVFDPHGYDKSDFYDEIEADIRRELERREQEKKKNQKLEFTPGGIQAVNVVPTPNINIPTPGLATVVGGVSNPTSALSDVTSWDARQNKKLKWNTSWDARHNKTSKWDKMDGDPRSSLPPEGKENISAVRSALDALISTAEAGLVQQMRRQGGR